MIHVLVAGAGLAGLSAARALDGRGFRVTLIESRDRVGGRVWTIRDGFTSRQHAEAGADFLESGHTATLALARDLGLTLAPIIRHGFGYYGTDRRGRLSLQSMAGAFRAIGGAIHPLIHDYRLAERRWDSAIARDLARRSVASWLVETGAPDWLVRRVRGMRGLFLADPEDLSLLALVDFLADVGEPALDEAYRLREGNDRLATGVAERLKSPVRLRSILRRVRQTGRGIVATIEKSSGRADLAADYLVCTLPASTLREVEFEPALPEPQHGAVTHLRYGPATRLLLQFATRFWVKRGRPNAFGSDQPIGAIWDGNEQQKGAAILSFLAGGGASADLQAILTRDGVEGVLPRVAWLGKIPPLLASRTIVWEADPWARGGYAYFDPEFDPLWRDWLARPAGRIVFAGEHTSIRWQGYVNGAVESGLRAAAEIGALARS